MFKVIVFFAALLLPLNNYAQDQSAQGAAGSSAIQSLLTAGTNVATGAMLYTACMAPPGPPKTWLCVMGGLSVAQAGVDLLTGKSSKAAAKSIISGGGSADWDSVDLGNGLTGAQLDSKFSSVDSKFEQLKKDLAKQGIDINSGTAMTPKGKKSLGSLGSGKALADAGLISADQIPEADDILKKNNAKLAQIAMNTSTGGGGGGGGSSRATKYEYESPDYSGLFGDKEKPAAPKTAGLVKTVDGQPYGASVNNIFDMLRNRFEIKTRENFFVEK